MKAYKMYGDKIRNLCKVWVVYFLFLQPSSTLYCPTTIQNGILDSACSHVTGSNCSFTCNLGYRPLDTVNTLSCGPEGNWTPSNQCIEVICPATIPNGNIIMNNNCSRRIGNNCTYQCNDGFKANPNASTVTCKNTGQWEGASSLCQVYNCPANIPNGLLSSSCRRTVGEKCDYSCSVTFHQNASIPMITCRISGWEPNVATLCTEQDRGILVSFPATDQLFKGDIVVIPTTMEGMPIISDSLIISFPVNQQLFSMATDYKLKHLLAYSHLQNGILLNSDFEMGFGGSRAYNLMHIGLSNRYIKLAVDWVSHNVYWTDPNFSWISMQNEMMTDTDLYTVIIETDIDAPHGIAVDPITGYLFWSDIGNLAKIERSNLVGEDRHVLTFNLDFPISLAADLKSNSLYWVDSIRDTVEVCAYNGLNRRVLIKDMSRKFLDIAVLQDFLYVTDYAQRKLLFINKTNDVLNVKSIGFSHGPIGVTAYSPDIQPVPSKVACPANCSDICVELPAGHRCLCREGYLYNESTNQCQENLGIFHRGILISNATSICLLDIRILATHQSYPLQCFLDASNVTFMAMKMAQRQIFFTNSSGIYYTKVDSSHIIQLMPSTNNISGMSFDWIDDNIYWCEKTTGTIRVFSLRTRSSMIIISNLTEPRDILVVPHYRKMFWISGKDNSVVQVSNLTGTDTFIIRNSSRNSVPHSLKFNLLSQVLFWIEGQMIKSYDLNTHLIKENVINSPNATLLSSYKNQLVWTSNTSRPSVLFAYDIKLNTTPVVIASFSDTGRIGAMMIFDPTLQPNEKGPCDELNGLCEQICIPQGSNRECRCEAGYTLHNETSCISDPVSENFLLVSDWTHHKIYQLDLSAYNIYGIDVLYTKSPAGIAYNPKIKKLYWGSFDQLNNVITTAFLNGSREEVLVDIYPNDIYPEQIAIDFSTGNIFFTAPARIPYVLTQKGYIGVLSSNGRHSRKLILGVDRVFDIVLHPQQGRMFWTLGGSNGCIYRANMDGTNSVKIISNTISSPYGLTIDYKANILYWTNWNDQILSIHTNGSFQNVLYEDHGSSLGDIVFGGGYLYFTAWNKQHITRINPANTSDVIQLFDHGLFGTLEGLAIHIGEEQPVNTLCANNNGNCSTFCLPTSVGRSCACNDDVDLLYDGLTCSDAIQCPDKVWRGNITDQCPRNIGARCGVVCDQGYKPSTINMVLECQLNGASGVWNNMYPCKAIMCPSTVLDALISPNCSLLLGTDCTYSCKNGYYDVGPGHILCINDSMDGGKWSDERPCKAATCPSTVLNAVISTNCSYLLGTNCSYTCESGYHDEGPSYILCVNDTKNGGKWSVDLPCKATTCPSTVPNTVISPNCSHLLGTNCSYKCESGYHDEGPSYILCINDTKNGGKWSVDIPCKATTCPSTVPNAEISPNCSHLLGANCSYTCESGYHDEGPSYILCINDTKNGSKWSVDLPCKATTCPSTVPNTEISPNCSHLLGTNCSYTCESGYHDEGPSYILCINDTKNGGKWSVDIPCKATICPSTVPNAVISPNCSHLLGTNCSYKCESGYHDEGPSYILCINDTKNGGKWSVDIPCKATTCPSTVPNAEISPNCSHLLGTNCSYTCESGYHDEGPSSILCINDTKNGGKWSVDIPCKATTCPSTVPNAVISPNCSHLLGTNCSYTCESGYHDEGPSYILCINDTKNGGKWSVDLPCKGITCPSAVPNAVISPNCSYLLGTNCSYTCENGYHDEGHSDFLCVNDTKNGGKWSVDIPCSGTTKTEAHSDSSPLGATVGAPLIIALGIIIVIAIILIRRCRHSTGSRQRLKEEAESTHYHDVSIGASGEISGIDNAAYVTVERDNIMFHSRGSGCDLEEAVRSASLTDTDAGCESVQDSDVSVCISDKIMLQEKESEA